MPKPVKQIEKKTLGPTGSQLITYTLKSKGRTDRNKNDVRAPVERMITENDFYKNQENIEEKMEEEEKNEKEIEYQEDEDDNFEYNKPKPLVIHQPRYTAVNEQNLDPTIEYIYNDKNIGMYQGKTEDGVFVFEYFILSFSQLSGLTRALERSNLMNIKYHEGGERDTYLRERAKRINQKRIDDEDARFQKIEDDKDAQEERENILKAIAESMAFDEDIGRVDTKQIDNYLNYVRENQVALLKDINKIRKKIKGLNYQKWIVFAETMKKDIKAFINSKQIIKNPYEGLGSYKFEREYLTDEYDKYKDYYLLHNNMDDYTEQSARPVALKAAQVAAAGPPAAAARAAAASSAPAAPSSAAAAPAAAPSAWGLFVPTIFTKAASAASGAAIGTASYLKDAAIGTAGYLGSSAANWARDKTNFPQDRTGTGIVFAKKEAPPYTPPVAPLSSDDDTEVSNTFNALKVRRSDQAEFYGNPKIYHGEYDYRYLSDTELMDIAKKIVGEKKAAAAANQMSLYGGKRKSKRKQKRSRKQKKSKKQRR
jgi:hypothetical protein